MMYVSGFIHLTWLLTRSLVTTKKTKGSQFVWTGELDSNGCVHSCTIAEDTSGEAVLGETGLDRMRGGTAVTLFLKKEHMNYAVESHLIDLTKKYVEHVMYPVYISVKNDDDQKKKKTKGVILYDAPKERILNGAPKERIADDKFEKLRVVFEKIIGRRVDQVELDDCFPELATHLSSDKKRFVINPTSPIVEELRLILEAGGEEEVEDLVQLHFDKCTTNIFAYDLIHDTNYYRDPDLHKAMRRPPENYVALNKKARQGLIDACLEREKAKMSMDMKICGSSSIVN